ncbi:MAG: RNase adapter RapZ [Bacteroides sp.]|nr:RNase adapter RapZ [Eubacterium sp.]MCM1417180.1 RNase adapter RapZ [Roseburia sp.]MCM1461199.1 RNase adapter RapZ [Bacteroides sp.]
MEFVIVTGVSGSGKSCVAKALEDIGFFCIDNMPPQLIPEFAEICRDKVLIEKVAIVTDIRGGELFLKLWDNIDKMRELGINVKVLFLYSDEAVIKRRYKETRRKHPLYDIANGDLDRAVAAEFEIMMPIREHCDYTIDTSLMSTAKLKESVLNIFLENIGDSMMISCVSFGFKYGVPDEADLVFDVRCLPNPFYVPALKEKTGMDREVQDFVMKHETARLLSAKLYDLIDFLIPQYISEGKSQLVIAFGCTGGKHRSVTFAEKMYEHLNEKNYKVRILHRDSGK